MKKLRPNRAQLFVRNKYTVFTMGGTVHVALRSVNKKISGELQICSYIKMYLPVKTVTPRRSPKIYFTKNLYVILI